MAVPRMDRAKEQLYQALQIPHLPHILGWGRGVGAASLEAKGSPVELSHLPPSTQHAAPGHCLSLELEQNIIWARMELLFWREAWQ